MFPAAPKPGQGACFGIGKDRRTVNDFGLRRIRNGYFDDVNSKQGGTIVAWRCADTALKLLFFADVRSSRIVDNDGVLIAAHNGVRV